MFKSFITIILLSFSAFSVTVTQQPGSFTKTSTAFTNLSPNWYMVEKSPLALGAFTASEAYWGFFAKKNTITDYQGKVDLLDTFNIGGYYFYSGEVKLFNWDVGEIQTDLDSIKSYLNRKWISQSNDRYTMNTKFQYSKQDSIASFFKMFKSDSMYAIVSLPYKSTIKIYKNFKATWTLKSTITSSAKLLNLKTFNGQTYLQSNDNLYNISTGIPQVIATNVLGFNIDNQGIWLTNSSGELSYLKNGTRTIIKTNSQYVQSNFIVSPIDTTFFYNQSSNGKILNSLYNDYYNYYPGGNNVYSVSWVPSLSYIDKNNDIWNYSLGVKIEEESKNLKSTSFIYSYLFDRVFNPSVDPEKFVFNEPSIATGNTIYEYKLNSKPYFNNNSFTDSLGYLDEQTQKIFYMDTIHAYDNSTNERLYYSIVQNPVNASLVDSIFTINTLNIPTGTYTIKFQVRDNFSLPCSDTLSYTFKVYSRKIKINKTVTTTSTEDLVYTQNITSSDVDNDSSFLSYSKLPSWLTISRTGKNQFKITGTPVYASLDTSIQVILRRVFESMSAFHLN